MGELIEVLSNYMILKRVILYTLFITLLGPPKASYGSCIISNNQIEQEVDSLSKLAMEHHAWTVKHHDAPGMLDSVIFRTKKALEIREKLWKENPNVHLGKSYHNLGAFLRKKGDLGEAKKYLIEAVSVFTILKENRVFKSSLELGLIYNEEGDFVSAEEYFLTIIQNSKASINDKTTRSAIVNLGSTYVNSFRDTMAIDHLEKYIDYFDVGNKNDKVILGQFYNNLASAYLRNENYDKAISTYNKASLIDLTNFAEQAKIYTNLAIAYRLKKEYKKCYSALIKGKEMSYKCKDLEQMSFSHNGLAKYHEFRSEFELALSEYQKAIELLIPSFTSKDDFSNPKPSDLTYIVNKILLLTFLSFKVEVIIALGKEKHKQEILELFKLGDQLIDDMRSDHFIDDTKLYWRSVAFPFYEEALKYCHEEKVYEEAFYFFEKSKSVLLLEGYSFNEAISKTTPLEKERYQNLKALINESQKEKSDKSIDEIVNSQHNFETFIDSLSITYPHLFKKYKEQTLLSLPEFQKEFVKDSSTIYIHYFYGKESVFAFGIEHKKITFLNLGKTQKIDSLTVNLKRFFLHPAQIDNEFDSYKKAANELYEKLLAPLIQNEHKEVVVLPDGPFATIPFESLVSSYGEGQEFRYVIQDRVIRYSFSGSILSNMKDSDQRGAYDVVTFVPFIENQNKQGTNFSGVLQKDFKTAKQNGINVKHYTGNKATKKSLFSFDERLPILHFSSHGFEDEGEEPKILLANSSITLSELFTSTLPADMVFLSACRTNSGKNASGEGIQSMARGFTFAGANSVVSSLWNVIADPNSNIVRRFYENLSLGQPKHMALHNAKLSYIEDANAPLFEKSPYYWSGLVYYGEDDHILKPKITNQSNMIYLFGFIIILLIGSFFGIKSYRNQRV